MAPGYRKVPGIPASRENQGRGGSRRSSRKGSMSIRRLAGPQEGHERVIGGSKEGRSYFLVVAG